MAINPAAAIEIFSNHGLKALNEELDAKGLPVQKAKDVAATLLVTGIRSQGEFAAICINLAEGDLDGGDLKPLLKAAFPEAKIGDRHGPYYLSHARTGQLKGCRFQPMTSVERRRRDNPSKKVDISKMSAAELQKAAEWRAQEEQAAEAK